MRLVIVRQDYRPDGPAERVTERALEALLERNVAVSLYTRSWPQTRLQLIEPLTCDPFYAGALWRDWGFARAACKAVRRAKPTLVEAHQPMLCCDVYHAGAGVHAVWLEERMRRASPMERLAAMLSPRNRYRLAVEKRLYASPWLRAVICNCRMVRDEIRGRFGLAESTLHVVYNPVDTDLFHPGLRAARATILGRYRIAAEATVYLAVAPDFIRCGVDTAIAAVAGLAPPSHLIVVGDDRDIDRLRGTARRRGIAGRVTFAGPQDDLRPFYGAADAFVLPSLYDPSPRTVQEAMACGLATITSTKSGGAELVQENGAGLVCPSGDAYGLAACMQALQDPAKRAEFSANARRAALALSPSAITLQLVLLYRDLLSGAATASTSGAAPQSTPGAGGMPASSGDADPAAAAALPELDTPVARSSPTATQSPTAVGESAPRST
jgi:UDP-glucose:(heptosyl)LPS alpha-1,3-glucosyltransferase